jgi:PAS domain S-box-containing protein/putative nucleotidyltransferase with HDIG domain
MKQRKKKNNSKGITNKNSVLWGLFFEKLLENMDACVLVTDSAGSVLFVNKRGLDIFGMSRKDIMEKKWVNRLVPKESRRDVLKIFSEIKRDKEIGRFNSPVNAPGSSEKYFCWLVLPLKEKRSFFYMFTGREEECSAKRGVRKHSLRSGKLHKAYQEIVETLFAASRVSDPGTAEHAARVMFIAVRLAKKLKMGVTSIGKLKVASLLHDLGKLAIDNKILLKNGKLTKKEFDEIKKHPHWGADVIQLVYFLRDIIPIMANHHENYNGSGYPNGAKGNDIPIEARALSVADVYEALTADRPYRRGFSSKEALAIIEEEKGKKFDPVITDVFLDMVRSGELKEEDL